MKLNKFNIFQYFRIWGWGFAITAPLVHLQRCAEAWLEGWIGPNQKLSLMDAKMGSILQPTKLGL